MSLADLEASASFSLTLGDDEASKIAKAAAGLVYPVEFFGATEGNQTKRTDPASGVDYIRLACHQRCPASCWWEVRSWRMTKNGTPFTAGASEVAYVFTGDSGSDFSSGSWQDSSATALPVPAFYSSGQVVIYPGGQIYFAITAFDTTATYQVRGNALQRPYGTSPEDLG